MIRSNLNCLKRIYGSHIHTIICFTRTHNGCKWDSLRNVRLLRVLDVVDAYFIVYNIFRLPSRVINLYHLKFLALSHRVEIPAAISNLQNLQTLIIHPHSESLSLESSLHLPLEIWRMQQLRHLVSSNFYDLDHPAGDTLALENLQTLSQVRNFKCTQQVVQMIPNLKKLAIFYCEDQYGRDYKLENLRYLHRLERLKFMIDGNLHIQQKLNPNFPATLKSLSLSGCRFAWEDMQIVAHSLPKLEVLKLRHYAFEGSIWETSEGEFPRLKFLLIKESHLREWITESYHFPSLKRLVLHRCWWLSEIPDIFVDIPTLELIEVDCLSKTSLVESAKKIQEEQQDCGNDALQVRIVFYNEWTKKYQ